MIDNIIRFLGPNPYHSGLSAYLSFLLSAALSVALVYFFDCTWSLAGVVFIGFLAIIYFRAGWLEKND